MKKTLLVTIDFPPSVGGVAAYWQTLSQLLPREKWVVLADGAASDNESIHHRPLLFRWIWPRWLKGCFAIHRLYREQGCEQVMVAQVLPVGTMTYILHLLFGIPYIVQVYGMDLATLSQLPRKRWLAGKILRSASRCLANSEATGQRLMAFGVKSYTVVYPIPELKAAPGELDAHAQSLMKGKSVILSLGRLVERKGHDLMIKALPEVLKTCPDALYVIAGDGPNRQALEAQTSSLGLADHVFFAGAVSEQEKQAWLSVCNLLVMPARQTSTDVEGFGMVFLEAYAYGKPVIGGRSGGIAEAVQDNKSGLLVDPSSPQELAAAIIKLLQDQDLAKRLGQGGRDLLKNQFSAAQMRETVMSVL